MKNQRRSRSAGRWAIGLLLLAAAAGCALLARAAQKKAPQGSVFVADRGKLTVLLDGQAVGHEEFEIVPNGGGWIAKGSSTLKPPQGAGSTVSGSLTLQPGGAPVSYDWTAQTEKTNGAHVVFLNGVAKMTLQMQGAHSFEQDLTFSSPSIVVLDNNLYHQYAVLARVYDWAKRGKQDFSVLIPQELTPGTLSVEATGAAVVEGKSYDGLKVLTSDLELMLYLDGGHRLMRMEVPSAKVSVVRD